MRVRAEVEAWAPRPEPAGGGSAIGRAWSGPARTIALGGLGRVGLPAMFGLVAVFFGASAWANVLSFDAAGAGRAGAVVVASTDPGPPLLPYDVEVRFTSRDRELTATVASADHLEPGTEVAIRHDRRRPERARLDGPLDRTTQAAAITGAAALACVAVAAWQGTTLLLYLSRVRRIRSLPPQPMRYVLFEDAGGSPGVALFGAEGDPPPVAYVPLWSPLPRGLAVAGSAVVRGKPEEGERVVVDAGGRVLWPGGSVEVADAEDALALFNARPPAGDAD